MNDLTLWLEQGLGVPPDVQIRILETFLTIILLWAVNRVIGYLLNRSVKNVEYRYQWQKGLSYFITVVGAVIIGRIWLAGMETLVTFLGLLSAGIAIALKDPLMNIAGWVYILMRKPFDVGDRIEISGVAGDVIDIRLFQFSILEIGNWVQADQSTGRVLHVPNGVIFTMILGNYTRGFDYIWNEIQVLITFESNWKKAKILLQKIVDDYAAEELPNIEKNLRNVSQPYMLKVGMITPIVYTAVESSGVMLTIRYLCTPRYRRSSTSQIWEATLEAFSKEPDVSLAYPTQRFYSTDEKGPDLWREKSNTKA
jgi:small-conductance mechanosensitive channel